MGGRFSHPHELLNGAHCVVHPGDLNSCRVRGHPDRSGLSASSRKPLDSKGFCPGIVGLFESTGLERVSASTRSLTLGTTIEAEIGEGDLM